MEEKQLPKEVQNEIANKAAAYADQAHANDGDDIHIGYLDGATAYATKLHQLQSQYENDMRGNNETISGLRAEFLHLQTKYDNILATESGHESKTENVWQSGYAAGHEAGSEKRITDAAERIADKLMMIVRKQLGVGKELTSDEQRVMNKTSGRLFVREAQPSAVWVKASEFKTHKPIYRPYRKPTEYEEGEYDYGEIYATEDDGRIYLDVDNENNYEHQSDERWKGYEILDESAAGREDKLYFDNWHRWLSENGYTYDGEYYYDEDNNYFTPEQLWAKFKSTTKGEVR